jgi:hypothetical protein
MGVTGSSLHVCWPQCLFQGFPKIVAGRKDLKPAEPSKRSDFKKKTKKKKRLNLMKKHQKKTA